MKKLLGLFFVIALVSQSTFAAKANVSSGSIIAEGKKMGIGLKLGLLPEISGQMYLSRLNSIEAGISFLGFGTGFFMVNGAYLWHFPEAFKHPEFSAYAGPGVSVGSYGYGGIGSAANFAVAARGAGGLQWAPRTVPLSVFTEIAAVMLVYPGVALLPNWTVGARYFF